jgi:hypothetical protein
VPLLVKVPPVLMVQVVLLEPGFNVPALVKVVIEERVKLVVALKVELLVKLPKVEIVVVAGMFNVPLLVKEALLVPDLNSVATFKVAPEGIA